MPRRPVDEMTAFQLNRAVKEIETGKAPPRKIFVGGVGGLSLNVRLRNYALGDRISASWVLRWTIGGKRRDVALGGWPDVPLDDAREEAWEVRRKIRRGEDVIAERAARREAETKRVEAKVVRTFRVASRDYFERTKKGKINARDQRMWFNDLESFVYPIIGDLSVDEVETRHLVEIADQPHIRSGAAKAKRPWDAVPDRAVRCIKKVWAILQAELAFGHLKGPNPAEWKHRLKPILGEPNIKGKH